MKKDKCIRYETDPIYSLMKIAKVTPCFSNGQSKNLAYGFTLFYENVKDSEIVIRLRDLSGVPSQAVENEAIERYIEITHTLPSLAKRKD